MTTGAATALTTTINDLRQLCDANPLGPDGRRKGRVNLRNISLQSVDLRGCDLTDVDLWGADLRNANLETTKGLEARSISGADVTGARLPAEIAEFKGVDALADIVPAASAQFLALLGVCLYCLITIAATKDSALILNTSTQSLPIVQTAIPLIGFYALAPLILVVLLAYLQLNLQRMWEALASLPAKFPDGRPIDERVYPWVYIQRVRAYYPGLQYSLSARIETYLGSVLSYLAVPFTLIFSCRRVAVMHSVGLTAWHIALFSLSVLIGLLAWWSSRDALLGSLASRQVSLMRWPYAGWTFMAALSVFLFAWAATGPWYGAAANLRGQDLSVRPAGWNPASSDVSQVTGAALTGAKLSGADMQNAFLVNATLASADLRNAKLTNADLRGANLSHANLAGATLQDANLQDAVLRGATFGDDTVGVQRVRQAANWVLAHYGQTALIALGLPLEHDDRLKTNNFQHYQLPLAGQTIILNFRHAALAEANFTGVDLTSADFSAADLTGASLKKCILKQAKFLNSSIAHCDLSGADLTGASGLTETQLKSAVFCKDTILPERLKHLASQEACQE